MDNLYRTSDTWKAVALWCSGWPLLHAELDADGKSVVFVFPDGGDELSNDADAHARGELMIPSVAVQEGHRQCRELIRSTLNL